MDIRDQPAATADQALQQTRTTAPSTEIPEWQLQTILEIARILASQHEFESMLSQFLARIIDTLDAAECGILQVYDPADQVLVVKGGLGYDIELLTKIRLTPGEAMGGRAFKTGTSALYKTPEEVAAARFNLHPESEALFEAAAEGLGKPLSAVCVPLITGQKRLGALLLENRGRPHSFTESDMAFLERVADLIALAIENERLRQDLQAARALYEANRLKAELISTLAHEMRTPLTSIKGYSTALLMEEAHFDPETQAEFLQIIDQECDVLQDLIHDLLESSVIDAGLLRLEPQPLLLPRLAQTVLDDVARRTEKHHFLVDFPPAFPIVDADPHRISQVLRNVLDNSIKYSPEGGLIVVRGRIDSAEAVISVSDQGAGIAPDDLNRLFEKFFRVKAGLGRHVVGSGLGLPISRTIVEAHGGRIWAESKPGQGTTLYFTIPLGGPSQELDEQGADR